MHELPRLAEGYITLMKFPTLQRKFNLKAVCRQSDDVYSMYCIRHLPPTPVARRDVVYCFTPGRDVLILKGLGIL
jgi:hypothetical protein